MNCHAFGCARRPFSATYSATRPNSWWPMCASGWSCDDFAMGLTVNVNLSIGAGCTRKLCFMFCLILIQGDLQRHTAKFLVADVSLPFVKGRSLTFRLKCIIGGGRMGFQTFFASEVGAVGLLVLPPFVRMVALKPPRARGLGS